MWSGVISYVLQRYVGRYVENFNSENVSLGLFRGDLTLENLTLRKDALLDMLDLPLVVKSGYIGKITLRIPSYTQIRTQPWVFSIERLYVVAGPAALKKSDPRREAETERDRKGEKLDALEAKWWRIVKSEEEKQEGGAWGSSWMSYGTTLAYNIVHNIQVSIKDVHIRYEDDVTIPGMTFAWGIIIKQLTAQTSNSQDKPTNPTPVDSDVTYKLLDLQDFCIFWDSGVETVGHLSLDQIKTALDKDADFTKTKHCYILEPVSLSGTLKRYTTPLPVRSASTPRIELNLSLDRLQLTLTQNQFKAMVALLNEFDRFDRQRSHRHRRPAVTVKENPGAWWQFAIGEQLSQLSRRSANQIAERARQTVTYVRSYENYLLGLADANAQDAVILRRQIEASWNIGELLGLRELAIERASKRIGEMKVSRPEKAPATGSWWGNWWSAAAAEAPEEGPQSDWPTEVDSIDVAALALDEDTDTLLKRDAVFARLSFTLSSASIRLVENSTNQKPRPLVTLEGQSLSIGFESRPRFRSLLFSAGIGALSLHDQTTADTVFPVLVAPQQKRSGGNREILFSCLYELNPRDSAADCRFRVRTDPLQVVYNPALFRRVVNFFQEARSTMHIRAAARHHYQHMKARTRANIRQLIDQIKSGENPEVAGGGLGRRWEVELDICAPQILVPDSFTRRDTACVLFDFGRLELRNYQAGIRKESEKEVDPPDFQSVESNDEDEESDFATPCGTPTESMFFSRCDSAESWLSATTDANQSDVQALSADQLEARIYERYSLRLVDLQILVGRVAEMSRFTELHAVSTLAPSMLPSTGPSLSRTIPSSTDLSHQLHLVDKFSLTVQLKRLLLKGRDDEYPNILVEGELPHFLLQLTDYKVLAFERCMATLLERADSPVPEEETHRQRHVSEGATHRVKRTSGRSRTHGSGATQGAPASSVKLVVAKFVMAELVVQLESRDRAVAEFKLSGAEATWTQLLGRQEVELCVRSLIVADAMSNLGQDLDLLVASHRNIRLDSLSGSINVSHPQSPDYPASPRESETPGLVQEGGGRSRVVQRISQASIRAFNVVAEKLSSLVPPGSDGEFVEVVELEPPALIRVHYEWRDADENEEAPSQFLDVNFSSLDVIGNQETLVEIVSFFRRINPANTFRQRKDSTSKSPRVQRERMLVHTEARVTFERLNLLLIRIVGCDLDREARKIGTITLSGANLEAVLGEAEFVTASLQGLQVLDLTALGGLHGHILTVGSLPTSSLGVPVSLATQEPLHVATDQTDYAFGTASEPASSSNALMCTVYRERTILVDAVSGQSAPANEVEVTCQLASVVYLHAPRFLWELGRCVDEFREYTGRLAATLRLAATEMAKSVINPAANVTAASAGIGNASSLLYIPRSRDVSFGQSLFEDTDLDQTGSLPIGCDNALECSTAIRLNLHLQTPVIVLPKTRTSREVLVGHLGDITVTNQPHEMDEETLGSSQLEEDTSGPVGRVFVKFRDCNVYALNLDAFLGVSGSQLLDLYRRTDVGQAVVDNTTITLQISNSTSFHPSHSDSAEDMASFAEQLHAGAPHSDKESPTSRLCLRIQSRMVQPLDVRLSQNVYEQMIRSLDNLVYDEADELVIEEEGSAPGISPRSGMFSAEKEAEQTQESSSTDSGDQGKSGNHTRVEIDFALPKLSVEMLCNLGEGPQGLARLVMTQLTFRMVKVSAFVKELDLRLWSLRLEDLLQTDAKCMLESTQQMETADGTEFTLSRAQLLLSRTRGHSSSCPGLDSAFLEDSNEEEALPRKRCDSMPHLIGQPFEYAEEKKESLRVHPTVSKCPTPPPTPTPERSRQQLKEGLPPLKFASKGPKKEEKPREDLVHIRAKLVDRKSPEFVDKYNSTSRFIEVAFSSLTCRLNLHSWVLLLDFLGLGAKIHDPEEVLRLADVTKVARGYSKKADGEDEDVINSEIEVSVSSFTLLLNKEEYELARALMAHFNVHVSLRDGNMALEGQLGEVQLSDSSPNGRHYPQRFVTVTNGGDMSGLSPGSTPLLEFHLFKYGLPDPGLTRDEDMRLRLRLAPIYYVHTQYFLAELIAFLQNFNQYQDIIGRARASTAGKKISDRAPRASRIRLDVQARAPIIFLPQSASADAVLVVDLGRFSLGNDFYRSRPEGSASPGFEGGVSSLVGSPDKPGRAAVVERSNLYSLSTVRAASLEPAPMSPGPVPLSMTQGIYLASSQASDDSSSFWSSGVADPDNSTEEPGLMNASNEEGPCLLDCMHMELSDMDLYAARRCERSTLVVGGYVPDGAPTPITLEFPTFSVVAEGRRPLKEKCSLQLGAERNLESDRSHSAPDWNIKGELSRVLCSLDVGQYVLVRGILEHNLGQDTSAIQSRKVFAHPPEPGIQTVLTGRVWKGMSIRLDLHNVTLELLEDGPQGQPARDFCQLDFIRSRLLYESFSDQSKVTDLACAEVLVHDTRYKDLPVNNRPNVFSTMLQPTASSLRTSANLATPTPESDTQEGQDISGMQMELRFRSTESTNRFDILLNNMRLMVVFDWLLKAKDFLVTGPEPPTQLGSIGVEKDQGSKWTRLTDNPYLGLRSLGNMAPVEEQKKPLELSLRVTGTEFVVVESASALDTNAVILKGCADVCHRPHTSSRPLSCSLRDLEVFSCSLAAEDDTALSIVDPMTLTIQLNRHIIPKSKRAAMPKWTARGLQDVFDEELPLLEFWFSTIKLRLSYNDLQLFLGILRSLPRQTEGVGAGTKKEAHVPPPPANLQAQPAAVRDKWSAEMQQHLQTLGLDAATAWSNRSHDDSQSGEDLESISRRQEGVVANLARLTSGVRLKSNTSESPYISLCIIDDCLDADVPLAEIKLTEMKFDWKLTESRAGWARFLLSADYYNRDLSGWEPFVEPWKCDVDWREEYMEEKSKLALGIYSVAPLNINMTLPLLNLLEQTKDKWSRDMGGDTDSLVDTSYLSGRDSPAFGAFRGSGYRRRVPFVPFRLLNRTGCTLYFKTITASSNELGLDADTEELNMMDVSDDQSWTLVQDSFTPRQVRRSSQSGGAMGVGLSVAVESDQWTRVGVDERAPVVLESGGVDKLRHERETRRREHRLVVQVEGWDAAQPVTVDRLGVFFRHVHPDSKRTVLGTFRPTRVVFEVCREGTAQKLITIRSALQVVNSLQDKLEVKMESGALVGGVRSKSLLLEPGTILPVPMTHVDAKVWVRPVGGHWSVDFSDRPILWKEVEKPGEVQESMLSCRCIGGSRSDPNPYQLWVELRREAFPLRPRGFAGHCVTLHSPLIVTNLLPVDISYYLKGTSIKGFIKAGKEAAVHLVNNSAALEFGVMTDQFPTCEELTIPPCTYDHLVLMKLFDHKKRVLELQVQVVTKSEGARRLRVSAVHWLVNRSSLPLVFGQSGCPEEASGQSEEHEIARSLSPLLFSFPNKNEGQLLVLRIGKGYRFPTQPSGSTSRDIKPSWSTRISLDKPGVDTLQLRLISRDNRPDWVYNIGVEVRRGRGRYEPTMVVTFKPRYMLENQSKYRLAFAQRHLVMEGGHDSPMGMLVAYPRCCLAFHWPRQDLDPLLCVRPADLDLQSGLSSGSDSGSSHGASTSNKLVRWSGGFKIDHPNSFHIIMRGDNGLHYFLRVGIVLQGATFYVVFSDVDQLPLPYRVDNMSEVSLVFYQTKAPDSSLKSLIRPRSSMDYAWDEPTLPSYVTLSVTSGSTGTYNLNVLGEGDKLHYQNFVYIVMTSTDGSSAELVFDVLADSKKVVLAKKVPGRRSQLWWVSPSGELYHEGSAPPRDPRSEPDRTSGLLLDLDALAPQPAEPGKLVRLRLTRADRRRERLQRWRFTRDGRLMNKARLYAQARAVIEGAEMLCGVSMDPEDRPPDRMAIGRHWLRCGSGVLDVRVVTDGPTRVLLVEDASNNSRGLRQHSEDDWLCVEKEQRGTKSERKETATTISQRQQDLQVTVCLNEGIGISIINELPEELVYISLRDIQIAFSRVDNSEFLELKVADIQIDNQLLDASLPILLYTPDPKLGRSSSQSELSKAGPGRESVLTLSYQRELQTRWNAHIFTYLVMHVRRVNVEVEERVLLKLILFLGRREGRGQGYDSLPAPEEEEDYQRTQAAATFTEGKRFYFGQLKLTTGAMTLSVLTSSNLPAELKEIKSLIPSLMSFANAQISMEPFERSHMFETRLLVMREFSRHYRIQLRQQAIRIFGSVDFLGNPVGFITDISTGISGLVEDFNVKGLVKHVTHGVTDSTAKVIGSMSQLVQTMSMDSMHQARRAHLLEEAGKKGGIAHLSAGFQGLAHGVSGGISSIVTQPYRGLHQEGFEGLVFGMGKGVLGTVTKPLGGLLDFVTGAVTSIREVARSSSEGRPQRVRRPRSCTDIGRLVPAYATSQAIGQEVLLRLAEKTERFMLIAVLQASHPNDQVQALVSNKAVRLIRTSGEDSVEVMPPLFYTKLATCRVSDQKNTYYVEFIVRPSGSKSTNQAAARGPSVRCDSLEIADRLALDIREALFRSQEEAMTLNTT